MHQVKQEDHTGGNNTFQYGQVENALCLISAAYNKEGLLFALYRIIRKQAAQHTTIKQEEHTRQINDDRRE